MSRKHTRSLAVALLCHGLSGAAGCQTVDRDAERDFMEGRHAEAIRSLEVRKEASAYDFVLESSLLASAALRAGDYRTARTALDGAAAASELGNRTTELPTRVTRARIRRSNAFYRLTSDEAAMNAVYRTLLILQNDPQAFEAASDALESGLNSDSDAERDATTDVAGLLLLGALIAAKSRSTQERELFLNRFRTLAGHHPCAEAQTLFDANTIIWIDRGLIPERADNRRPLSSPLGSQDQVRFRCGNGQWRTPALAVDLSGNSTRPGGFTPDSPRQPVESDPRENSLWGVLGGSLTLLTGWRRGESARYWHLLPRQGYLWVGNLTESERAGPVDIIFERADHRPEEQQRWHLPAVRSKIDVYYFRDGNPASENNR